MPFTARSAATIRDELLSTWATSYRLRGADLAIDRDSDAYAEADALSLLLEGLEIQASLNANQVLIAKASGGGLDDWARDDGTARRAAVTARRHVTLSGPSSTTTPLGGAYLTSASGLRYNPISPDGTALTSVATDSGGAAVILVECERAGALGSISTGTVLTWSSPPTGFASTGTVSATTTNRREGAERERDEVLRRRLLERRRERPASGNRADWREKVREVAGVADAFVYPLAMPPATYPGVSTPHTLGCVTVLAVGAPNESVDEPVNGRFTIGGAAGPGERCTQLEDYIEGDRDADLNVTTTGGQWRPASLPQDNYCVKTPQADARSFEIQIKNATGSAFPWVYDAGMTVHSSSTSTSLVVNGDHTAKNSKNALVRVGTSVIRGGYAQVNLGAGSYNSGTGLTTWSVADMGGAPIPVHVVLPRPPNYTAVKEAVIAYLDSLGPGEYTGSPAASARHPSPDSVSPSAVYLSALAAAVITGVPTVLAATVTSPVADVLPVDEAMVDLSYLTVRSL